MGLLTKPECHCHCKPIQFHETERKSLHVLTFWEYGCKTELTTSNGLGDFLLRRSTCFGIADTFAIPLSGQTIIRFQQKEVRKNGCVFVT